jgi:hypothetical protein
LKQPYGQLTVDGLAAAIEFAMQPQVEARAKELGVQETGGCLLFSMLIMSRYMELP